MEIQLRPWDSSMKAELADLCNRADRSFLSDRMPSPYTEKDAEFWLGYVKEREGRDGVFREILVDGIPAGSISVERKADVFCRDGELGYHLMKEYWSKGIMTKAVKEISAIAFEQLSLLRISGTVYAANTASGRVLEKNGFQQEGRIRSGAYKNGQVYDLLSYGILREDFEHNA